MKLIKCYLFPNDNVPGLLVSLSVLRQIGPGPWRCVMGTRPAAASAGLPHSSGSPTLPQRSSRRCALGLFGKGSPGVDQVHFLAVNPTLICHSASISGLQEI